MMTLGSAEENFLEVAVAAIPRITEIITASPPNIARVHWRWRNAAIWKRLGISAVLK